MNSLEERNQRETAEYRRGRRLGRAEVAIAGALLYLAALTLHPYLPKAIGTVQMISEAK